MTEPVGALIPVEVEADGEGRGRGTKTPGLAKDTHESLPAERVLALDLEAYGEDFNARVVGAYAT
ncbi:MAG TPA: hypothetical protein VFX28_06810, partial [Methylomirabilota bacterium]|nr:hypothetical protein [Methylomirabilota bacterium]